MDQERIKTLISQYFNNSISRKDCMELLKYMDDHEEVVSPLIDKYLQAEELSGEFSSYQKEQTYDRILSTLNRSNSSKKNWIKLISSRRVLYPVAAVLMIAILVGGLIYQNKNTEIPTQSLVLQDDILLPDSSNALLTLSDGKTILITESTEKIYERDGVHVGRSEDGSVYYKVEKRGRGSVDVEYNTLATPKGQTLHLTLADGTKVWLNAESSLRFPSAFSGAKREVELTGEAYFEVAHNSAMSFEVNAQGNIIHVLGTHFNVSAYEDQPQVSTTLVEGSVNVSSTNGNAMILEPGQQAIIEHSTGNISKSTVDVNSMLAWKRGYFRFDDESIESIIHAVSRWYDIESVEYDGSFDGRFTGTFKRSKKLSQLFSHLEKLSSMHFKIEEGRVTIMK